MVTIFFFLYNGERIMGNQNFQFDMYFFAMQANWNVYVFDQVITIINDMNHFIILEMK